ncbi:MAG: hypothetical protein H8E62_01650 [Planctomycetes bacterium]|nr:hypothetical protein [Planctomycetota bacterium]
MFVAYYILLMPILKVVVVTLGIMYLSLSFAWASLDLRSRKIAVKGHNMFVYFAIAMVILAFFITKEGELFPKWQIYALLAVGFICYSFSGIVAVKNFIKWRKGELQ